MYKESDAARTRRLVGISTPRERALYEREQERRTRPVQAAMSDRRREQMSKR